MENWLKEKLMMMNDGVKSPYSVLDYNDYELMKNPAKLLPAIDTPKIYLTFPDRQLGDPREPLTTQSVEDIEPPMVKQEAKLDCIPRKEAEEILTLGKGVQMLESELDDYGTAFAANETLGREGDMIEEPMKLRIEKPLCDD
ncbi:hypothetical protein L596_029453 [Steinernema carpocapsae]|uniref:Uncharacterized protein n=1 Tax=Steinernema carpocapsae TaxID=34508 RepID=A0A4U5LUP2_STECR|nr:hypothetical protein L596_029453 [Steinernema carpocapsae]